ncbi:MULTISPECIES: hypothetical protein [unclassified Mycobacterium]|nr:MULTISPECIES: hypothetical protein [unclassified Mycobacterium]
MTTTSTNPYPDVVPPDQRLALALQDVSAARTAMLEVRQLLSSSRAGR